MENTAVLGFLLQKMVNHAMELDTAHTTKIKSRDTMKLISFLKMQSYYTGHIYQQPFSIF